MDAKLLFSVAFVVVFGQAYSLSYPDTFKACMKDYNLEKDDVLKKYMSTGKFASDEETASYKCFFSCLTTKLSLSDSIGTMNGEALKKIAAENPTETELAVFASEPVHKACIPLPDKFPAGSVCDAVFYFTQCALETQASQLQNKNP